MGVNPQQLHLWTNHLPVIGSVWTLILLAAALWWPSAGLARAALSLAVLVGLTAGLAFLSGEPAEEMVEHTPGIAERAIEPHEDLAKVALIAAGAAALAAAGALVRSFRRPRERVPILLCTILMAAAVLALGLTAHQGGKIHRPELGRDAGAAPAHQVRAGAAGDGGIATTDREHRA